MVQLAVDLNNVDPNENMDPLPPGKYRAHICASELKQTRSNNGQYLKLELEVTDGELKGRKLWENLNLFHSNQQAKQIAERTLKSICVACGFETVPGGDSENLHFIEMEITVTIKPGDGQYAPSNNVKGYTALPARTQGGGRAPAAPMAAQTAPPPAQPASDSGLPWQ